MKATPFAIISVIASAIYAGIIGYFLAADRSIQFPFLVSPNVMLAFAPLVLCILIKNQFKPESEGFKKVIMCCLLIFFAFMLFAGISFNSPHARMIVALCICVYNSLVTLTLALSFTPRHAGAKDVQ